MYWMELLRHADGNERLSREQFVHANRAASVDTSRFNMVEGIPHAVFDVMDTDGDNTIDKTEFKQFLQVWGICTRTGWTRSHSWTPTGTKSSAATSTSARYGSSTTPPTWTPQAACSSGTSAGDMDAEVAGGQPSSASVLDRTRVAARVLLALNTGDTATETKQDLVGSLGQLRYTPLTLVEYLEHARAPASHLLALGLPMTETTVSSPIRSSPKYRYRTKPILRRSSCNGVRPHQAAAPGPQSVLYDHRAQDTHLPDRSHEADRPRRQGRTQITAARRMPPTRIIRQRAAHQLHDTGKRVADPLDQPQRSRRAVQGAGHKARKHRGSDLMTADVIPRPGLGAAVRHELTPLRARHRRAPGSRRCGPGADRRAHLGRASAAGGGLQRHRPPPPAARPHVAPALDLDPTTTPTARPRPRPPEPTCLRR